MQQIKYSAISFVYFYFLLRNMIYTLNLMKGLNSDLISTVRKGLTATLNNLRVIKKYNYTIIRTTTVNLKLQTYFQIDNDITH